jgi:hypothetical protein
MTTVEEHVDDVTPAVWVRLVGAGVAVFASFMGIVNLASIVGHYGVQWHLGIAQLVAEYKHTFYPFYDVFLRPLVHWFHLKLSPLLKDIVTLFALAFSAANAESIIRDGRMLMQSLMISIADLWSEGGWRPHTMLSRALPLRQGADGHDGLLGIAALLGLALLVVVDFKPIVGHRLSDLPLWYWRWLEIGLALAFVIGIVAAIRDSRSSEDESKDPPGWLIAIIVPLLLPTAPFLLYMMMFAAVSMLLLLTVFAPFIAWRTAGTTVALFLAMLFLNFLIGKGVV